MLARRPFFEEKERSGMIIYEKSRARFSPRRLTDAAWFGVAWLSSIWSYNTTLVWDERTAVRPTAPLMRHAAA